MPFLEREGKPTLHYCIDDFTDPWRNAPTIILQHGFGRSSQFWYSWVPYLSRFYKVVRPDLRGLGRSPSDFDLETGITVDAYIEDIVSLLDALGLESVHYCGESFGGILGMTLSARHPSRVRTLSLISAPVSVNQKHRDTFAVGHASREAALRSMGAKQWATATNGTTRFPTETDPGLLEWYASEMGKSDVEVLCALYRLVTTVSAEPYLKHIRAPVLGIYPTSGTITTPEQEQLLTINIPHMKFIHLPTRFHSVLTMAPSTCAQHVLHFAGQFDGIPCHE